MPKFRRTTLFNSAVISANLLHFKPIFDLYFKKIVREAPSPVGVALVRLGHSLNVCKNLGAQHPLGEEK